MKRSTMLGLALLIAGALAFSAGYFGGGRNLGALNGNLGPIDIRTGRGASYTEREYRAFMGGITKIVLDENNADVTVLTTGEAGAVGSGGDIVLTYQESGDDAMEITNENGVLTVKRRSRVGLYFFWFGDEDLHTELRIPRGMTVELSVETDNGGITVEDVYLKGDAAFSSDNGAISIKNIRAGELTLDNDNGKLEAADVDCAAFKAKTSNGRVTLTNISAETTLYAKTDNGAIAVDNVSAGKSVELRSSNGSIRGTLAGGGDDYRIESKTANGSNNLPSDWGKGDILLMVETANGSIDIQFAED